jgi:peroxiredoxin
MSVNPHMSATKKAALFLPWALAFMLASMNVLLIRRNIQIRNSITGRRPPQFLVGDRVPEFTGAGIDGRPLTVGYTGREPNRVLLYFTPACPYCREQFPYWKEIIDRGPSRGFEVIGIVADTEDRGAVVDYLRSFGCQDLSVSFVPKAVFSGYKLVETPTTLVIDNDGKVKRAWLGEWDADAVAAAATEFGFPIAKR